MAQHCKDSGQIDAQIRRHTGVGRQKLEQPPANAHGQHALEHIACRGHGGSLLAKGAQHVGHAGCTAAMIAHVVMIYEFADEDTGIHTAQQVCLQDGGCGNQDRFHH